MNQTRAGKANWRDIYLPNEQQKNKKTTLKPDLGLQWKALTSDYQYLSNRQTESN